MRLETTRRIESEIYEIRLTEESTTPGFHRFLLRDPRVTHEKQRTCRGVSEIRKLETKEQEANARDLRHVHYEVPP